MSIAEFCGITVVGVAIVGEFILPDRYPETPGFGKINCESTIKVDIARNKSRDIVLIIVTSLVTNGARYANGKQPKIKIGVDLTIIATWLTLAVIVVDVT